MSYLPEELKGKRYWRPDSPPGAVMAAHTPADTTKHGGTPAL